MIGKAARHGARYRFRRQAACAVAMFLALSAGTSRAAETIVDLGSNGERGQNSIGSTRASLSTDGRYVAFCSYYSLVAEDTDDGEDVYLKNTVTGAIEFFDLVPYSNCYTNRPQLSADGSVLFIQTNDIVNRTYTPNGNGGFFVYLRETDTLLDLPDSFGDGYARLLTRDGKRLLHMDLFEVRYFDIASWSEVASCNVNHNPAYTPNPEHGGGMNEPVASFDGSRIAFKTIRPVHPDAPAGSSNDQVYLADCDTNELHLISVNPETGELSAAFTLGNLQISGDGKIVLFRAPWEAGLGVNENYRYLTSYYLYDSESDTLSQVLLANPDVPYHQNFPDNLFLSHDGKRILYAADTNPIVGLYDPGMTDDRGPAIWDRATETASFVGFSEDGGPSSLINPFGISGDGNRALFRRDEDLILADMPNDVDAFIQVEANGPFADVTIVSPGALPTPRVWVIFSQTDAIGFIRPMNEGSANCESFVTAEEDNWTFGVGFIRTACQLTSSLKSSGMYTFTMQAFDGAEDLPITVELVTNNYDPDQQNNVAEWDTSVQAPPSSPPGGEGAGSSGGGATLWLLAIAFAAHSHRRSFVNVVDDPDRRRPLQAPNAYE